MDPYAYLSKWSRYSLDSQRSTVVLMVKLVKKKHSNTITDIAQRGVRGVETIPLHHS